MLTGFLQKKYLQAILPRIRPVYLLTSRKTPEDPTLIKKHGRYLVDIETTVVSSDTKSDNQIPSNTGLPRKRRYNKAPILLLSIIPSSSVLLIPQSKYPFTVAIE